MVEGVGLSTKIIKTAENQGKTITGLVLPRR